MFETLFTGPTSDQEAGDEAKINPFQIFKSDTELFRSVSLNISRDEMRKGGTHGASAVAVHGEVGAEEQVGDGKEQRLSQRSSAIVLLQLIGLENQIASIRLDQHEAVLLFITGGNRKEKKKHCSACARECV